MVGVNGTDGRRICYGRIRNRSGMTLKQYGKIRISTDTVCNLIYLYRVIEQIMYGRVFEYYNGWCQTIPLVEVIVSYIRDETQDVLVEMCFLFPVLNTTSVN